MTTPERLRARQRRESAALAVLALALAGSVVWFEAQDRDQRECLLSYIEADSATSKIRSNLVVKESDATRDIIERVFEGETTEQRLQAYADWKVAVREVDQARGRFYGPEQLAVAFGAEVPDLPDAEVRTLLAKFGLRAEHVLRPAVTLSPGERTRAALALLQARGVNVLVLDEPTNHLDLPAIEQLEQALAAYDGALLLVSHDRRLLANVELDQTWTVAAGSVRVHHG